MNKKMIMIGIIICMGSAAVALLLFGQENSETVSRIFFAAALIAMVGLGFSKRTKGSAEAIGFKGSIAIDS